MSDPNEIQVIIEPPLPNVEVVVQPPLPEIVVDIAEVGLVGPPGTPGTPGAPGPPGPPGADAGVQISQHATDLMVAHVNDIAPHPVYDNGPSLALIYQNAKV